MNHRTVAPDERANDGVRHEHDQLIQDRRRDRHARSPRRPFPLLANPFFLFGPVEPQPCRCAAPIAAAPSADDDDATEDFRARFRRQIVDYRTNEPAGTIIIDTPNTYLYLVLGNGRAMRYGIGVGRDGFTWSGVQTHHPPAEWPDWTPPAEMIARQPYLPRYMAGGPGNPLGARAMYLGSTIYRIHGTNAPHDHRPARVVGLHPPHQRRRDRPLQPRQRRHPRRGAAAGRPPSFGQSTASSRKVGTGFRTR